MQRNVSSGKHKSSKTRGQLRHSKHNAVFRPNAQTKVEIFQLERIPHQSRHSRRPAQIRACSRLCIDFVCNLPARKIRFTFGVNAPLGDVSNMEA